MSGAINVICATNAFGMGVDKPDVRFVIHHTMPMSLCNFHQESGRGGRDGEISESIIFYNPSDCGKLNGKIQIDINKCILMRCYLIFFFSKGMIFNNKYAPVKDAIINSRKQSISNMREYCENLNVCRRVQLLRVLGQSYDRDDCTKNSATTCDNCARYIQRSKSLKRPISGGSGQPSKKFKWIFTILNQTRLYFCKSIHAKLAKKSGGVTFTFKVYRR